MTTHTLEIPGIGGPIEIEEPGMLRGLVVRHGGLVLEKKSFFGHSYLVPTEGGAPAEIEVRVDALRGVVHVTGLGVSRTFGEPIPMWLAVVAALPFCLAFVGGMLGGVAGAIAWTLNRLVAARRDLHVLVRLGVIGVVSALATVGWIVTATIVTVLLH